MKKYYLNVYGGVNSKNIIDLICDILNKSANKKTISEILSTQPSTDPKIEFRKYVANTNTDMNNKMFYKDGEHYLLTNGANKSLVAGGGGTNKAITEILGNNAFNNDLYIKIYEPNKTVENNFILVQYQMAKNSYPAGTVFFIDTSKILNKKTKNENILGVYHINGYSYSSEGNDIRIKNYYIAKEYYEAILKHAIDIAKNNLNKTIKLVLQPIPGYLFSGGKEIHYSMIHAIENNLSLFPNNLYLILGIQQTDYEFVMNNNIEKVTEFI